MGAAAIASLVRRKDPDQQRCDILLPLLDEFYRRPQTGLVRRNACRGPRSNVTRVLNPTATSQVPRMPQGAAHGLPPLDRRPHLTTSLRPGMCCASQHKQIAHVCNGSKAVNLT